MITCTSCGARFSVESDYCELCGWPVGQEDHDMKPAPASPVSEKSSAEDLSTETPSSASTPVAANEVDTGAQNGVFCHMCGWQNPPDAKFCSDCGTRLQEATRKKRVIDKPAAGPTAAPEAATAQTGAAKTGANKAAAKKTPPPKAVAHEPEKQSKARPVQSMQMGMLVAAGVMVVAVLYMITLFSRRAFPEVEPAAAQAQTTTQEAEAANQSSQSGSQAAITSGELTGDLAARVAALEAEAEGLSGDAQLAKKREIVAVLVDANRLDKAAPVQEEIAGLTGAAEDWFAAGDFYFNWMDSQNGENRFAVAQRAAAAFEEGLKQDPNDLDVKTSLAMIYLNTRAPMQGVQQIRAVLDEDPDHLRGNFFYGVMLMQINRVDQARTQFERVKQLTGPENPLYQQADMMLQNLNR